MNVQDDLQVKDVYDRITVNMVKWEHRLGGEMSLKSLSHWVYWEKQEVSLDL